MSSQAKSGAPFDPEQLLKQLGMSDQQMEQARESSCCCKLLTGFCCLLCCPLTCPLLCCAACCVACCAGKKAAARGRVSGEGWQGGEGGEGAPQTQQPAGLQMQQ